MESRTQDSSLFQCSAEVAAVQILEAWIRCQAVDSLLSDEALKGAAQWYAQCETECIAQ